ncbi:MAG: pseudaminic acid cytidylyltransferase [Deltaproteobacteria bacterium CG_4_10_14_0_2_um_filter_43_8]|nr:MAG: pseudaminic acid cytidylyltransferase [Deltaproteobacteria bacterium CG11_big_fil_rev_8_21_14_0_20_42_23]PJA18395.1 MAG: pseudaminic acid cytidylyltransferase [Deltaproteobacteria bacterium CG_4_10_14_0_2_um_filter_43_8]PJC64552.1 MAG: pseudaminic acid cytidylyltransferase [Deltaproteobacteria bacterium CG_4_9_14_0_2_um_filter_42_21]
MRIAVIPARGGSKRIPFKNIKDFCGKPIIAWSIEVAKKSSLFDHVIVSTDSSEIAEVAKKYGAEVPFIRPPELSDDHIGTAEVVAHATQWALDQEFNLNAVCCIYPTAPFIQVDDLKRGLEILESGEWAYTFTATDFSSPIFRSFQKNEEGSIEMVFPEHFLTRSQDLPIALHDAGQFYWGRPSVWREKKTIFAPHSTPVLLPRWRVQDIDTPEDWDRAQMMWKVLQAEDTRK